MDIQYSAILVLAYSHSDKQLTFLNLKAERNRVKAFSHQVDVKTRIIWISYTIKRGLELMQSNDNESDEDFLVLKRIEERAKHSCGQISE